MGNDVWHVALEPGTTKMQDVIVVNLAVIDFEMIKILLSTNHLKGRIVETSGGNSTIVDMRNEDSWILKHVWREWLMLEKTDAEYVPPKQFLVMRR